MGLENYFDFLSSEVDAYLQACREHEERMHRQQQVNPLPAVKRLREIAQQRHKARADTSSLSP